MATKIKSETLSDGSTIQTPAYLFNIQKRGKQHAKELAQFQKMTKKKAASLDIVLIELFNQELASGIMAHSLLSPALLEALESDKEAKNFQNKVADLSKTLKAYQNFLDGVLESLDAYRSNAKKISGKVSKAQAAKLADKLLAFLGPDYAKS